MEIYIARSATGCWVVSKSVHLGVILVAMTVLCEQAKRAAMSETYAFMSDLKSMMVSW